MRGCRVNACLPPTGPAGGRGAQTCPQTQQPQHRLSRQPETWGQLSSTQRSRGVKEASYPVSGVTVLDLCPCR